MTIRKTKHFKNQAVVNRTFKIIHFSTIKRMTYSNHPTDCIELFMSFSENEKKERSILGFKRITISFENIFQQPSLNPISYWTATFFHRFKHTKTQFTAFRKGII